MKSIWTLLPAALLVAVLALAGCGGGSSDDTPAEPTEPTKPTEPAGPTALETSATAKNAALAARKQAMALLAGARTASANISTAKVDGDSRLAEDNAETVLAATALIMAEEAKAAAAVQTAEGVDTAGLSAEQQNSIAADVMAAKDALAEIQAILADTSGTSIMKIVEALMGTSTDATKVAAARNNAVATAIKSAIAGTGLSADPVTISASVAYDLVPETASLMRVGTPGRTFREITGADSRRARDVAAATYGIAATVTEVPEAGVTGAWKGIPGSLECVSTTPPCPIEDGVIRGTVHFIPTDPAVFYTATDDGSGYKVANNGAVYGYWLDGTAIRHHAATRSDATQGAAANLDGLNWTRNDLGADGEATVTRASDITASYDGTAGGFSERTIGTGATAQHSSGHFAADASLKATFGATDAAISGTIRNFSAATGSAGSGHVNANWVVALSPRLSTTGNFVNGGIDADHEYRSGEVGATSGAWSANAYGAPLQRSAGFVGAFNAGFTDGSATGVYHVDAE